MTAMASSPQAFGGGITAAVDHHDPYYKPLEAGQTFLDRFPGVPEGVLLVKALIRKYGVPIQLSLTPYADSYPAH